MNTTNKDITILTSVLTKKRMRGRLYYYQGNFYYPLGLIKKDEDRVRRAITNFKIKNRDMIIQDQSHPNYKTILEIHDEQVRLHCS